MPDKIETLTGRCRCGALSFTADVSRGYGVCHCTSCRRWTSGVWMGVEVKGALHYDGPLERQDSSARAERAWCGACGSPIHYKLRLSGHVFLSQGAFDDQSGWTRLREIHADDRPDHYAFGPAAPAFTGWGTVWAALTGRLPR